MSNLEDLAKLSKKFRDERAWKKFHDPKNLAIDLSVEAAEVLEHFLWVNKKEVKNFTTEKKEEIADELSDVLNPLLLLADTLNINLQEAFKRKLAKNSKKYPIEKSKGKHTKYNKL